MLIKEIHIENVRNLQNVTIEPDEAINYFYGKNAAGKTALLEAIFLLARAKSFRTPRIREIITKNEKKLCITAKLKDHNDDPSSIGIEYDQKETRLKYRNNKVRKISEQAKNLPLFLFTPDSQRILTGRPKERRNWLDWALFHVEHTYIDIWKDYHKALRQRNKLLRLDRPISEILPWEKEIAKFGNQLEQSRGNYLSELQNLICKGLNQFSGETSIEYSGVSGDLLEYLVANREKDRELGTTQTGPHRAEVKFQINGKNAAKILSRGQIKLYTATVILGQTAHYMGMNNEKPILLVDDIAAELDDDNRENLIQQLSALGIQIFINATGKNVFENQRQKRMFHVKQGMIIAV